MVEVEIERVLRRLSVDEEAGVWISGWLNGEVRIDTEGGIDAVYKPIASHRSTPSILSVRSH